MNKEDQEYFESLQEENKKICEQMIETERKLVDRISKLEKIHQSDCITINQLNTALDVMTEKYQRLREKTRL